MRAELRQNQANQYFYPKNAPKVGKNAVFGQFWPCSPHKTASGGINMPSFELKQPAGTSTPSWDDLHGSNSYLRKKS